MLLPYFANTTVQIGPITIFVWGAFVAGGIGIFLWRARALASRFPQVSFETILDATVWMLVGVVVGARLAHVFLYEPAFFLAHPVEIFMVWHGGLASTGGITGGVVAALLFFWKKKLPLLSYADIICAAMPLGWVVGRIGCYLTHMHPGVRVSEQALFAVAYPDGPRADLGLYEAVAWVIIAVAVWFAQKKSHHPGFYLVLVALSYSVVRFVLDFFRATDVAMPDMRYAGLTPAQYAMIALFIIGALFALKLQRRARS